MIKRSNFTITLFFNNVQIYDNLLNNHVMLNHFSLPLVVKSIKNPILVENTEEILQQHDLEQIALLEQKLKNISQ